MAQQEHLEILKQGKEAWNQWRKVNPDIQPDLQGADLILRSLDGFDLNRACLSNTRLWGQTMHFAKLCDASLVKADLRRATLIGADLRAADLTEADLAETTFVETDLRNANFTRAEVTLTQFLDSNLSGVQGLFTRDRHGLSALCDRKTFKKSNFSKLHLRILNPSATEQQLEFAMKNLGLDLQSCMISYSHADQEFARRLHDALHERGVHCWLDEKQILPGDDIYDQIDRGIRLWDRMLLCCSEHSLTSWWVDNEIATALEKEQQFSKERGQKVLVLIPLNLDGYIFRDEWKSGYRAQIRRRLAADFTGWKCESAEFEVRIENLLRALRVDDEARERPPEERL